MAHSSDRPAVQMLHQVFEEAQIKEHAALSKYFEEQGSIFPLLEKGVSGLTEEYRLSPEQARLLLRRANSMATYLRRQYIEHTLAGTSGKTPSSFSGFLSIIPGPSYEGLFHTAFEQLSPPQALESCMSPVAYLMQLLRWIEQRISPKGDSAQTYPLDDRRTDLKSLTVDYSAVHQSVSAVDIIVPVLETFIEAHSDPQLKLDEALLSARYPNGLPYYQHWVSLDGVTRHHGMSVGHVAQRVDMQFPYFLQRKAWDADFGRALAHASRLGPYQRKLLSEAPVEFEDRDRFYEDNFGTVDVASGNLNQVVFFGERTKLDSENIEALLSVRDHAPVRSPNVLFDPVIAPTLPESERSGSVYLNAHSSPAVAINFDTAFHRLSLTPNNANDVGRFDRINRKIRLDNWLGLPSEQTDALLVAAMNAEARSSDAAKTWQISSNVIHALGLFQALREHYGCTAEDFAAFIDTVSVYGRGETASHFDRIFNNQGQYREPLKLDNKKFPVQPQAGASDLTVNQLCSGLGIDLQTYQYLALAIARAQNAGNELTRNQSVISSFYRLVRLPRLLGVTPIEGVLLLELLGEDDWLNALAADPQINESGAGIPDVLSLIDSLEACIQWCRERDLPVLWVLQHVAKPQASNVPSEQDQQLFEKIGNLSAAALFSNARLLMAGVPALPSASWLDLLSVNDGEGNASLVDPQGLVLGFEGSETDDWTFALKRLGNAVDEGLGIIDATLRATLAEKMLGVLLQARQAQVSVVKESLAVYAGVDAEQALAILQWARSDVYSLLAQVMETNGQAPEGVARSNLLEQNPLLTLLADLRRRSEVVVELELSALLLQEYLDYGYREWMTVPVDKHAFSMSTLYYLTTLSRAFGMSDKPQQTLLDYLRQVNHLPTLEANALALAQKAAAIRLAEFFGWSVQEVRECINRMEAPDLILKNLIQLDLLMRVRLLSARANMDALALFLIGKLPEDVDQERYAEAAEHALLSMAEAVPAVAQLEGELKKLVNITCVSDKQTLVAGKVGEKAIFTVTLQDESGLPLSGITVYWQATLGTIFSAETDIKGVLKAVYTPGKIMGTETPMFWLNLFDPEYAPAINISFDTQTLKFLPQDLSPVPTGPVGLGQEIELYAFLKDAHSNPGQNSLVRWEYKATGVSAALDMNIRPRQSYTNQEGLARAFISSAVAATFIVSVHSQASDSGTNFEPISFQDGGSPA